MSLDIAIFVVIFLWLVWLTNNIRLLKKKKKKRDKKYYANEEVDSIWRTKDDKIGLSKL